MKELVNIVVALSNLYGLILFIGETTLSMKLLSVAMIATSTLMHLSETKHGLPGVKPYNKYSTLFLWLDRIMAIICISVVTYFIYYNGLPSMMVIILATIGVIACFISEVILTNQWGLFVVYHITWHIAAYTTMFCVTKCSSIDICPMECKMCWY